MAVDAGKLHRESRAGMLFASAVFLLAVLFPTACDPSGSSDREAIERADGPSGTANVPPAGAAEPAAEPSGAADTRPAGGTGPIEGAPGGAPPHEPAWSLSGGRLVFEKHLADRVNIYRYDAGASGPVPLTTHLAADQRPRWSADGARVAFFSNLRDSDDIWVVNADGSDLHRVTDDPNADFDPAWLPDGRLLFASDRDGDDNIYALDLTDGSLTQLTRYRGGRTGGPTPARDGRRIAFSSDQVFSWQLYTLDLASGAIERLTGPFPGSCNPSWRPGTGLIAYMSGGDMVGTDLAVIDADGNRSGDLGPSQGNNHDPEFSEDGSRLVWASDRDGNWEIWEADGDGGGPRRVSRTPEDERHPDIWIGEGSP